MVVPSIIGHTVFGDKCRIPNKKALPNALIHCIGHSEQNKYS
jgi:hypothetical protein